jgi:hypothetical protein
MGVTKVKSSIASYMWSWRMNKARTKVAWGCFLAMDTLKMQSQKRNFIILQLQDFLVNYGLYEMLIPFGLYM